MKSLLVPIVLSTTVGIGGVVVAPIVTSVALNPQPVMPIKDYFEFDDWSTIAEWASKGFEKFKERYEYDYIKNGNTFVGLQKEMVIDNIPYSMVVIDENRDVNVETGEKTTLTIQFNNLIDIPDSNTLFFQFDQETNNWSESTLKQLLIQLIQPKIEQVLHRSIPLVEKKMFSGSSLTTTNETLFIPSEDDISPLATNANRGIVYKYYINEPTDTYTPSAKRTITPVGSDTDYIYWLRNIEYHGNRLSLCGYEGKIQWLTTPDNTNAITAIFNI